MSRKVFMSYSWKDAAVANRLYDDLVRSHINVWRDQIDGDPTADFQYEFLSKIDECDDFLILDSINYRQRSKWCVHEIERCLENRSRRNGPRIIVCLLDEDGEWRWHFGDKSKKEVFTKLNRFKYYGLYYGGTYDNEGIYQKSLMEICSLFDNTYIPWNTLPDAQDLIEELSAMEGEISRDDYNLLLSEYDNILRTIKAQRDAEGHFKLWLNDCEEIGIKLFFPAWTYCVWLGQNSHGGRLDEQCLEQFRRLTEAFPDDPRGFRGLGCIMAKLGMHEQAEKVFRHTIAMLNMPQNKHHKDYAEYEVTYNLAMTLANENKLFEAISCFRICDGIARRQGLKDLSMILNYAHCLAGVGYLGSIKKMLMSVYPVYSLDGEFQAELGLTLAALGEVVTAVKCLEKSYSLQPSVKNAFYLLCRKSALGEHGEVRDMARKILDGDSESQDDLYWKGAICFYLLGNEAAAGAYFDRCGPAYQWYGI